MNKHEIDEKIDNIVEKSKTQKPGLWHDAFLNYREFIVPKELVDIVIKEIDQPILPRHIRYIEKRIKHLMEWCIFEINNDED